MFSSVTSGLDTNTEMSVFPASCLPPWEPVFGPKYDKKYIKPNKTRL